MLKQILSDLLQVDDILFVVKGQGAVSEIRSNSLGIRQKEKWITIGENDGPCHMHIDASNIKEARFIKEQKTDRVSHSIRFFDKNGEKQFSTVFAKMYDEKMNLIESRKKLYDNLFEKYGSNEILEFNFQTA